MSAIDIEGMNFYAYHGCFEEESRIGTHFRVDLGLDVDTSVAQVSDNIEDTVNYLSVYQVVKRQMEIPSRLLENVAERIASAVLCDFLPVKQVKVKVSKLNPPLGGKIDCVSVTIKKVR